MKVIVYVVALALFIGGILLFGYSFQLAQGMAFMFFGGIVAVSIALAIPFHLLGKQSH